jgi:hypothetical protein
MLSRNKLFAAFLPIAALGLMAAENTDSAGYAMESQLVAATTTLEAASYGRAAIRGARPGDEVFSGAASSMPADIALRGGHPRRLDARSLPQDHGGFVLTANETHPFGVRGARS